MVDKADLWMPLYIGDYLRDTRTLTLEEHGAYMLLLMEYWVSGPLPDDDIRLARLVGCSEHAWSMLRASLEQFFQVKGGRWRHKRVDAERTKAGNLKEARKTKAKAAAEARWGRQEDAQGDAPSIALGNTPRSASRYPPSPSQSHNVDDDGDARESAPAQLDFVELANAIAAASGLRIDPSSAKFGDQITLMKSWREFGATDEVILAAIATELAKAPERISSLKWFDAPVRQHAAKERNRSNGTATRAEDRPRSRTGSRAEEMDIAVDRLLAGQPPGS